MVATTTTQTIWIKMETLKNIHEVKDFKYFGWEIYPPRKNKKNLIDWKDFMKRLKTSSQPRKLINIKELNQSLSPDGAQKVILSDKNT